MEFQPVKNAIAVLTVEKVEVTQGGSPPTKLKLTCSSQYTWNYTAKQGQPNCSPVMQVGARIKISYDVVESTKYAGTMMKFINEAIPARDDEAQTWPTKEPYAPGGGGGNRSGGGFSGGGSNADQFRTPVQIQRQEVMSAVATLQSGCGCSMSDFLTMCDEALAWADTTTDATFPEADAVGDGLAGSNAGFGLGSSAGLSALSAPGGLASAAAPNSDDDIPF